MIIIIVALVVVGVLWAINTTNDFQKKELKVIESLSGVEVALTKRYDMLTKMMKVAKGYAAHEKKLLTEVVKLRKNMAIEELNEASQKMDKIMDAINVTAEAYPELRSSEVFVELQRDRKSVV